MPTQAQLDFVAAELERCQSTCVCCERRPTREGQTRCDACVKSLDEDDGAKRTKLTPEQLEGRSGKFSNEVAPPSGRAG